MIELNKFQISKTSVLRMPNYLKFLKDLQSRGVKYVSSATLGETMGLSGSVVKKDLSRAIVSEGKPKKGYLVSELIKDIESFLGYDDTNNAVVAGIGQMGRALMSYSGFLNYGINIEAGFDINPSVIGTKVNGKLIFSLGKMEDLVKRLGIKTGIITVPKEAAQEVADIMVKAGIRAIWNFAPTFIKVPDNVILKNEDIAASLAELSNKLKMLLENEE